MDKAFVVQQVATKLIATERSLDNTLVEASELMADLLKARRELNLSAVFGDAAASKLVAAISALGEARTAMVDCHAELNDSRLRLGVRTRMAGAEEKPPKGGINPGEMSTLREVG